MVYSGGRGILGADSEAKESPRETGRWGRSPARRGWDGRGESPGAALCSPHTKSSRGRHPPQHPALRTSLSHTSRARFCVSEISWSQKQPGVRGSVTQLEDTTHGVTSPCDDGAATTARLTPFIGGLDPGHPGKRQGARFLAQSG